MNKLNKKLCLQRFGAWWIVVSIIVFMLSTIVLFSPEWDHRWMKSATLWFSLSACGPAFIALMLNAVSELRKLGAEVSDKPPGITLHPIRIAIGSILFLGLALETTLFVDVFPFERWANKLAFLIACSFFLSYGALAYMYVTTFLFAVRLGKVRLRGDVFSWPRESIRAIHNVYVRLLLVGSTTYLLGVGVVRLTPWATSWNSLDQPWIYLWVLPPGLALVFYFCTFSQALHKMLLQYRSRAECEINEQLQRMYDLWKKDLEPSSESSISALITWRDNIRGEKVWTMDFKTVIATIVTLLIPTIEAIAKLVAWGNI